jgi:5-formyltetrahydrofolate cyclo-ligase
MKTILRKQIQALRDSFDEDLLFEKNLKISQCLQENSDFQAAENILFYASLPREVDTLELIDQAFESGKSVFLPKIQGDTIEIGRAESWEDLIEDKMGILEPRFALEKGHEIQMDVILVPGLAFDHEGNRLGYGKGHYDRLLKSLSGLKIGLAFKEQILDELPHAAHDVPMDIIITDEGPLTPKH